MSQTEMKLSLIRFCRCVHFWTRLFGFRNMVNINQLSTSEEYILTVSFLSVRDLPVFSFQSFGTPVCPLWINRQVIGFRIDSSEGDEVGITCHTIAGPDGSTVWSLRLRPSLPPGLIHRSPQFIGVVRQRMMKLTSVQQSAPSLHSYRRALLW